MKVELRSVVSPGDIQRERVTLRVKQDTDVGEYLVFRGTLSEGSLLAAIDNPIWFPDKPLKVGDLIVIYTKSGEEREKTLSTGKMAHFYYLGLDHCIWDKQYAAPVVLHAPIWEARSVSELI